MLSPYRVWQGISAIVVILGLIDGIDYIHANYWPIPPEIHADDVTDNSSLILPFIARNKSQLFGMDNVKFRCGVDLVYAKDLLGQAVAIRDVAFVTGIYSFPGNGFLHYPRNASDLLQIRSDDSLSMFGSSTNFQSKQQTKYLGPWTIVKMCIWVGGDYYVAGLIPWKFRSVIFQWPAAANARKWIEGPIARQPPKEEVIPGFFADALQCSSSIRYPYGLVDGPGGRDDSHSQ